MKRCSLFLSTPTCSTSHILSQVIKSPLLFFLSHTYKKSLDPAYCTLWLFLKCVHLFPTLLLFSYTGFTELSPCPWEPYSNLSVFPWFSTLWPTYHSQDILSGLSSLFFLSSHSLANWLIIPYPGERMIYLNHKCENVPLHGLLKNPLYLLGNIWVLPQGLKGPLWPNAQLLVQAEFSASIGQLHVLSFAGCRMVSFLPEDLCCFLYLNI